MPIILVLVLPLSCIALSLIGSGVGPLLSPIVMIVKDISKIISYLLLLSFSFNAYFILIQILRDFIELFSRGFLILFSSSGRDLPHLEINILSQSNMQSQPYFYGHFLCFTDFSDSTNTDGGQQHGLNFN